MTWMVDKTGFNVIEVTDSGSATVARTMPHAKARQRAHLIAAAPELLEALQEHQQLIGLLSSCIRGGETLNDDGERLYHHRREQAAAATAKATQS